MRTVLSRCFGGRGRGVGRCSGSPFAVGTSCDRETVPSVLCRSSIRGRSAGDRHCCRDFGCGGRRAKPPSWRCRVALMVRRCFGSRGSARPESGVCGVTWLASSLRTFAKACFGGSSWAGFRHAVERCVVSEPWRAGHCGLLRRRAASCGFLTRQNRAGAAGGLRSNGSAGSTWTAWLAASWSLRFRGVRPVAMASAFATCTTELQSASVFGSRAGPDSLVRRLRAASGSSVEGCVAYCHGARGSADPSVAWQSPLGLAAVVILWSGAQGHGRLAVVTSVSVAARTIRKTSRSTLEYSGATTERAS
jgi:hypothetical protein